VPGGPGGFGGGNGGTDAGGDGGSGFGGAVFVRAGGILTIEDGSIIATNGVTAGQGGSGTTAGHPGQSAGGAFYLDSGVTLNYGVTTGNQSVQSDIAGPGGLAKIGAGTLFLSGTNSYSGGTAINGGALNVSVDASLGATSGGLTFNGGTLQFGSNFNLANTRAITLRSGGGTFDTNGFSTTISQGITGIGGLTKAGNGVLILRSANAYTGGTTINAGTLEAANVQALGTGGVTVNANGTLQVDSNFQIPIGALSGSGIVDLQPNSALGINVPTGVSSTFSGRLEGSPAATSPFSLPYFISLGSGTLHLSGTTTLYGVVGAFGGTLEFDSSTALSNNTFLAVSTGATVAVNQVNLSTAGLSEVQGTGGSIVLNGGSLTIKLPNGVSSLQDVFNGNISGTGSFGINGAGITQTLSGNNTNSGTTTITAGTLIAGSTTALSSASAFTVNGTLDLGGFSNTIGALNGTGTVTNSANPQQNAVLTVGQPRRTASGLFSGAIQDGPNSTVSLNLAGGVLVLTGSNTYTGGTTISGGVLNVSANNNLGAASGGLTFNGGTLQFGSAFNLANTRTITLNGAGGIFDTNGFNSNVSQGITGIGGLTKTGPGTLTLSGFNSYRGDTVLNAGTLVVNNAQALGLGNVTVNAGILKADPQAINVKGNYTQNAGGTLLLQVAGAGSGQYDFLNVSSNANLGGTLQLLDLGYKPKAGDQLTLVTAGGTVSGKFSPFVDPFATGSGYNTVDLVYGKKSVLLEFLQLTTPVPPVTPTPPIRVITTIDFASFALTPNQFAATNLLDAVQLDPRATNLMSFLYKEPLANLPRDFDKISPESLTAFYEISFSGANIQRLNLESRLEDIRGDSGFASGTGATVYLEDKADGKPSKNPLVLQPQREKRWDFWATSFGDFVHVDSDFNARGYKFTTGGIDLGIDYRLTDHLAFGLMGSYAHTWSDLRPGSIDVDSARGGIYATYFNKCFYINGGIYGGYNSYDSSRRGLQGNANGNSDGAEFSAFVSGGYDFHLGHLTVGPIASLQYTNVYVDSFREKGSLAPLSIHSDSEESLRSDVGFRASYRWQVGTVHLEPFLKATWEHEFKYSTLPITAGFANISGPSATFLGPAEGHDSAVVDAGISVSWTPCISTYVNYTGLLGRDRYDSNGVSGGIRIRF
jgi:outer membrane autotransporter protein